MYKNRIANLVSIINNDSVEIIKSIGSVIRAYFMSLFIAERL